MAHQAEPDVAWGPPDPADPSWPYYQENPQWYLGNKQGFPSKQSILEARDRVVEHNPKLRVVGVHLGSMEKNLDDIAARLDKYPNFAIDTAARMQYLMLTPTDKVRDFLVKYQDRVLYGTDLDMTATANVSQTIKDWRATYVRDWKYLATDETLKVGNKEVHGLKLPEPVLQKIFHDNALKWIPGL
jgi:predicted TIM-barrel fold metal-dependent hydrolase